MKLIMKALAQITPNYAGTQAPSQLETSIEMDSDTLAECYGDTAHAAKVSFNPDGVSDPQLVTAYSLPPQGDVAANSNISNYETDYIVTDQKK